MINAIAVGIALGREHDLIQFAHAKCAVLAPGKYFGFKTETAVNVDDNLGCTDEVYVEQRETVIALKFS